METIKTTENRSEEDKKSLRGTLASVGVVGAIIVIMWIAVFMLYMSRV